MTEILSDVRFFSSGPVRSYRPNATTVLRLAPAPRDSQRPAYSEGGGCPVGADKFPKRAAAPAKAQSVDCAHRYARIAAWKPKNGVERVRARCAKCKREKILPASEVAKGTGSWREKV